MTPKFWMVLGSSLPVYRHQTQLGAHREAERLARSCPGQEFTVLESVESVVNDTLRWTEHDDPENIPMANPPF